LKPGDNLVLTKRLGSGTLMAAHQRGLCRADWFDQMLTEMLMSHEAARDIARQFPISAATDVSGFGVAGHLLEMLLPSGYTAGLDIDAIWQMLLPGFDDLARTGIASTLAPANDHFFRKRVLWDHRIDDAEQTEIAALIDPQTSGGLLLGVPRDITGDLVFALRRAGYFANPIGSVLKDLNSQGVRLWFEAPLEFPPRSKRTWPRSGRDIFSPRWGRWLPGDELSSPG
jgi:selenide,water dikinase